MPPTQKNKLLLKVLLGAAAVALVILCTLLIQQYQHIRRLSYISARHQSLFRSLRGTGPLSAADASTTAAWMTFDYIDHVFSLPPQYLETKLAIVDARYPRLTIAEYAEDVGASQVSALTSVREAIRTYSAAK